MNNIRSEVNHQLTLSVSCSMSPYCDLYIYMIHTCRCIHMSNITSGTEGGHFHYRSVNYV